MGSKSLRLSQNDTKEAATTTGYAAVAAFIAYLLPLDAEGKALAGPAIIAALIWVTRFLLDTRDADINPSNDDSSGLSSNESNEHNNDA